MSSKIKFAGLLVAVSVFLWTCKEDEDPGLQLTDKISFLWNMHRSSTTNTFWYVVLSDTSGNVIEWKELADNVKLEMAYPSDRNRATVTLIRKDVPDISYVQMWSYTGLEAKLYSYEEPLLEDAPDGDEHLKVSAKDLQVFSPYVTGKANQRGYSFNDDGTIATVTWAMYDGETNDLFVSTQQNHNTNEDRRYLYLENIGHSDSIGLSAENLGELSEQPYHTVNYPTHQQALSGDGTYVYVHGLSADGASYDLDARVWQSDQVLKVSYPDLPTLFSKYQVEVFGYTSNGEYYYNSKTGSSPALDFQSMSTTMDKFIEASTKRLAVDLSGEGDVVIVGTSIRTNTLYVYYNITVPMSSKVRFTSPVFPDDLLEEIPTLTAINDKDIESVVILDLETSYQETFDGKIEHGLWVQPTDARSKVFTVNADAGRISRDAREVMKAYYTNPLQK